MKNYKNQYGTVYAVMLDKHNHPAIMASDPSDGWVVSGTLAPAVAAAEAKTHEELQTVLDTEAEERGWVSCNLPGACDDAFANPTTAAAGAAEPTETAAPASGDEQYPDWLSSAAKELADLMHSKHGIDPLKATVTDFRKFYGNSYTGRSGPQIPGFACTPKGVDLSFDSFGKNKQVNFTWLDFVTYLRSVLSAPEPSAAPAAEQPAPAVEKQTDDDLCANCLCRTCANYDSCEPAPECYDDKDFCAKERGSTTECESYKPRPTSSAAATAAVVTAAEVPARADAANTMAEPAAPLSEQTDDAAGSALAASTGSAPAAFDYSGLDEPTAEIMHNADRIMQTARRNYIFDTARGVKMAHDALASHYGGTFGKWCESYGMSRETANKLLQVFNLIDNSTSEEQSVLEQAPTTLLYAAAKPSAPAEAVEAVKAGDVTTMPEYKALLAELDRVKHEAELDRKECENTNAQADRLLAERNAMNQEVIRLHDADRRAEAAERRAESIEAQRRNLQEAEAAHAAKIRELESRPVDVAVRKPTDAEIERYRQEGYAKAQKEFAAQRDDESDFCETIADHAEAVADSCAEALAGWFRLAADIDDAAYAAGAEHIKALWLALREALQSGAWPTDDLDDDDDEEYDPDDDDEENSDE